MAWVTLTLELDGSSVGAFADALLAAGAQSVHLEDADAGGSAEVALYAEPGVAPAAWQRNRVRVLLAAHSDPDALVSAAAHDAGLAGVPAFRVDALAEQDWVRQSRSEHAPIRISGNLWIVPTWHEPPDAQACNVRIDPGLAFGTGTHPTTALVLRWLARVVPTLCEEDALARRRRSTRRAPGLRVLDYGCGSGILAIAAARLGAEQVHAVDSDPGALEATAANARANRVTVSARAPHELAPGDYQVIVANILANPLIMLAPLLLARVRPGGRLALSGILAAQAEEVIAAYAPSAALAVADEEDGWVLLTGERLAPPGSPTLP